MKHKDIQSLHEAKPEEIIKKLKEQQKQLAQMKRDRYTKQSKNVRQVRTIRTDIARMQTILRTKELSV